MIKHEAKPKKLIYFNWFLGVVNVLVLIAFVVSFVVVFRKSSDDETPNASTPALLTANNLQLDSERIVYETKSKEFKLKSLKNEIILQGKLGLTIKEEYLEKISVKKSDNGAVVEFITKLPDFAFSNTNLTINSKESTYAGQNIKCESFKWRKSVEDNAQEFQDCFSLKDGHYYGGAEQYLQQFWPINKQIHEPHRPYLTGLFGVSSSVMERYWLSSSGVAIIVNQSIPLFVSMNTTTMCFLASSKKPYSKHHIVKLDYEICRIEKEGDDYLKNLHLYVLNNYFDKPSDVPDDLMFKRPIWSTWAVYKKNINETTVMDFAKEILANNYTHCQLEIDDKWQTEYGDFDFDTKKFPNMKNLISQLKALNFRTTLWMHPFANVESKNFLQQAFNFYWVRAQNGLFPAFTFWWDGLAAGILDTTNPNATDWFVKELNDIQKNVGIDSFKFDAGEVEWLPTDFWLYNDKMSPDEYSISYAKMASRLGKMIEVRTGCQTQNLPIFVRMLDKDSRWGFDNGLKSVITTALVMSILGYPFILPDMIGGNAYGVLSNDTEGFNADLSVTVYPDYELYVRWAQVTAFMPSMQFSIPPWHYSNASADVNGICKKMVDLHESLVYPVLKEFAVKATQTGEAIIRPMWWVDASDENNLLIDDQFLVGDKILVAPILDKGAVKRDVYIPKGKWRDPNSSEVHTGPKRLKDYPAPIDKIPYFLSA